MLHLYYYFCLYSVLCIFSSLFSYRSIDVSYANSVPHQVLTTLHIRPTYPVTPHTNCYNVYIYSSAAEQKYLPI